MNSPWRLGIVVSHPIQYQVPLYRHLSAESCVRPYVFFLTRHGVAESYDPGFGRAIQYDVPLLQGYEYEFVRNYSPKPSPGRSWGVVNPSLPRSMRQAHLDAVLVHGYSHISSWLAFGTARTNGVPYLLRGESRPHTQSRSLRSALRSKLISPVVRHADACLAIGSENREFYLQHGAACSRIFLAPYSIDTKQFRSMGDVGRQERVARLRKLGLDPERPVVLFAAKLQPWKRPFDVVRAVDRLADTSLLIVGDGPLRAELEEHASTRPWMRVLGFINQTEIGKWYGLADVFVLPSEREPWGLAVNEAMAAGVLPIVSDTVGCGPDLVDGLGWIYPTGDVGALSHAISEALRRRGDPTRIDVIRQRSDMWSIAATARGIEEAMSFIMNR